MQYPKGVRESLMVNTSDDSAPESFYTDLFGKKCTQIKMDKNNEKKSQMVSWSRYRIHCFDWEEKI